VRKLFSPSTIWFLAASGHSSSLECGLQIGHFFYCLCLVPEPGNPSSIVFAIGLSGSGNVSLAGRHLLSFLSIPAALVPIAGGSPRFAVAISASKLVAAAAAPSSRHSVWSMHSHSGRS